MAEENIEDKDKQYVVLARKYRPQNFDDLVGQDALVQTLTNAIKNNRLHHAYVLTGIRGTGKTSTARIIARALNCTGKDGHGGPTIHPCGICDNCKAIAADRHIDVLELDAASRTGVDDIREILDGVRYKPTNARYKIYIIDEVHMLSKNAFNALLKTLEEPPAHVKFIFATTEIRKVPVTILSRCQRFDLQRLTIEDLNGLFHKIMAAEKLDFEEEALHLIAKAADGSARDGESLLDQAISLGGGVVKTDIVKEMIGLADRNQTFELFENLIKGDVAKVMENIQDQYKNGANPTAMLQDLINITHMSAKAKIIVDFCEDVSLAEMEHDFCRRVKDNVSIAVLSKIWQMMLKGISELAIAPVQIDALEMILIRIAYSASLPTPSELLNDVKKNSNLSQAATIQAPQFLKSQENSTSVVSPANEKAVFNQIEDLLKYLTDTKQMLLMYALKNDVAIEEFSSGQIKMTVSTKMADDFMLNLQKVLTEATGLKWKLDISKGQLGATIFDQEQAENTANKKSISEYPLVRAILEEFKGATFETMTRKINLDIVEEESEFRTPDSETYFDDDLTREE